MKHKVTWSMTIPLNKIHVQVTPIHLSPTICYSDTSYDPGEMSTNTLHFCQHMVFLFTYPVKQEYMQSEGLIFFAAVIGMGSYMYATLKIKAFYKNQKAAARRV